MGIFGRKRAAVAAVGLAALATASVANAAVMQQRPAASYQANGTVRKIIIVGNTAYLGGQFTAMIPSGGGTQVTRNHLAAVDMTTGGLLPWNPNANGTVYALLAAALATSTSAARSRRSAAPPTRTWPRSTAPMVGS